MGRPSLTPPPAAAFQTVDAPARGGDTAQDRLMMCHNDRGRPHTIRTPMIDKRGL